jgi:hypothetical protein
MNTYESVIKLTLKSGPEVYQLTAKEVSVVVRLTGLKKQTIREVMRLEQTHIL